MTLSETPSQSNDLVRPVIGGAVALLVVWCFSGWIADKGWGFVGWMTALFSGAFQFVGWNASAQMRRAGDSIRARRFWLAVMIITGAWTAYSAHHAYVIFVGEPPKLEGIEGLLAWLQQAAVLVVLSAWAFIEPLFGWAIEETEAAQAKGPMPAPASPPPPVEGQQKTPALPKRSRPELVRGAAAGAAIAGAVALAGCHDAKAQVEPSGRVPMDPGALPETLQAKSSTPRKAAVQEMPREPQYELARLLARQGEKSPTALKAATGVGLSTAKRYIAEVRSAVAA